MFAHATLQCLVILAFLLTLRPNADAQTTFITNINIIDVVEGRVAPSNTVMISGEAIVAVVRNGTPRPGASVVDGQGKFLIPGLWDMHAHHQLTGDASLPLFVATGVTGTRDMGGDWTSSCRCVNGRRRGKCWVH